MCGPLDQFPLLYEGTVGVFFITPILVLVLARKYSTLICVRLHPTDGQLCVNWISDSDYSLNGRKIQTLFDFPAASAYLFGLGNKILLLDLETMNQIFGWLKIIFAEGKRMTIQQSLIEKCFQNYLIPTFCIKVEQL